MKNLKVVKINRLIKYFIILSLFLFTSCSKEKINSTVDSVTGDVVHLIEAGVDHSQGKIEDNSTKNNSLE